MGPLNQLKSNELNTKRLILCGLNVSFKFHIQEGENNDKFFTHPRNPKALAAYLFAHNHLFYMMELLTGLLLMMLSLCEAPAVPSLRLDVYVSKHLHANTSLYTQFIVKSPVYLIPLQVHATLELLALVIVAFELCMKLRWLGFHTFIRHKRTMVKVIAFWMLRLVESGPLREGSHSAVCRPHVIVCGSAFVTAYCSRCLFSLFRCVCCCYSSWRP